MIDLARGERVQLRPPVDADRDRFVHAWDASKRLHRPWIDPGDGGAVFDRFLERNRGTTDRSLFVTRTRDDAIAGVFNISQIFLGSFRNAYLGYYALRPHAGKGYMAGGLRLVVRHAFGDLELHRIQANVQPANVRSSELLRAAGFRIEGFHPRYLRIDGAWRDHVSWVITAEETNDSAPTSVWAAGGVQLREVSSQNWEEVVALSARHDQARWVADVSRYLTLCRYGGTFHPLAIYAADIAVGFVMWGRDGADDSYWIGGLIIDRRFQRNGYGRAALEATIGFLARQPACREVALSYSPDNGVAKALYARAGFVESGETHDGEVVARKGIRRVPPRPPS